MCFSMKIWPACCAIATILLVGACSSDEQAPHAAQPATSTAPVAEQQVAPVPKPQVASGAVASSDKVKVPRIKSLKMFPSTFTAAANLRAVARCEDDTLPVEFVYKWYVNGAQYMFANDNELPAEAFVRGDVVHVEVTPRIHMADGKPLVSKDMMVLNAPPQIESTPEDAVMDASGYTYQVVASDADGDPLSYFLQQAPEGMAVDASSGVISWQPSQTDEHEVAFQVGVRDDHEGQSLQAVRLKLGAASQGGVQ